MFGWTNRAWTLISLRNRAVCSSLSCPPLGKIFRISKRWAKTFLTLYAIPSLELPKTSTISYPATVLPTSNPMSAPDQVISSGYNLSIFYEMLFSWVNYDDLQRLWNIDTGTY